MGEFSITDIVLLAIHGDGSIRKEELLKKIGGNGNINIDKVAKECFSLNYVTITEEIFEKITSYQLTKKGEIYCDELINSLTN